MGYYVKNLESKFRDTVPSIELNSRRADRK